MRDTPARSASSNPQAAPAPSAPAMPTDRGGPTRPRYLVIVSRAELDLWGQVAQYTRDLQGVQVLLDRRQRERRQRGQPVALERRRADRRRPPTAEGDLRRHPVLLVTLE